MKKFKALETKRQFIINKHIVGIDPGKKAHQAVIINSHGIRCGKAFTFNNSRRGYENFIAKVKQQASESNGHNIVFAIETSCNLWLTLLHFLREQDFAVVLVSPLTTKHSRPMLNHDFSRTDPKDALLVADNARHGHFDFFVDYSEDQQTLHALGIAYDKLRKDLVQQRNRIHALLDRIFPEFCQVVNLESKTAAWLLSRYLFPQDFIRLDMPADALKLKSVSHGHHGRALLEKLQQLATQSIGIHYSQQQMLAERLILDGWLQQMIVVEKQMAQIMEQMTRLAAKTPWLNILTSIRGISVTLAVLFIAEVRDLSLFSHFKQIEKLAGYNLWQSQSGDYYGPRHISHIGNKRLSWILYKMSEEAIKYVPEVRVKFLKRQLRQRRYRKNVVACASKLLQLIMALIKEDRCYQARKNSQLAALEKRYKLLKKLDKIRYKKPAA
jgi:transposase